jgi:FMN reductase
MKIVGLSGSIVGSKTRTAMNYTLKAATEKYPDAEVTLIDLAEYNVQFSDGRNYLELSEHRFFRCPFQRH